MLFLFPSRFKTFTILDLFYSRHLLLILFYNITPDMFQLRTLILFICVVLGPFRQCAKFLIPRVWLLKFVITSVECFVLFLRLDEYYFASPIFVFICQASGPCVKVWMVMFSSVPIWFSFSFLCTLCFLFLPAVFAVMPWSFLGFLYKILDDFRVVNYISNVFVWFTSAKSCPSEYVCKFGPYPTWNYCPHADSKPCMVC